MFRPKEAILMFGAGAGARRAHACLRHRCRVVAFVDNDPRRHGTYFLRRPVVGPSALGTMSWSRIHIASMYSDAIYRQLTLELGVDPARIVVVSRPVLEGAYEVSRWTYALLGALTTAALALVIVAGYLVLGI
ncbi:MAG: hypothetical protein AB7I50_00155 [Vicinamibacterales bacterium]